MTYPRWELTTKLDETADLVVQYLEENLGSPETLLDHEATEATLITLLIVAVHQRTCNLPTTLNADIQLMRRLHALTACLLNVAEQTERRLNEGNEG